MKSNKSISIVVLLVLTALILAGISIGSSHQSKVPSSPAEAYAKSQSLPSEIVAVLKILDHDSIMDSNEHTLIDCLGDLREYANNPLVTSALKQIINDCTVSNAELQSFQDVDKDYVANTMEIIYGTNPTNIDTDEGGVDDFNEIFTYSMDPTNSNDDKTFLNNLPNVTANFWTQIVGGIPEWANYDEKYITISLRDPYIQFLANHTRIEWVTNSEGKTEGRLFVNGSPINYEAKATLGATAVPSPAYYFSHNRTATCLPSSLAEVTILKAVGYKAVLVGGSIRTGANETVGHMWVEAHIDGQIYTVDYNRVVPRPASYDEWGWNATNLNFEREPYDSNWYLK